MTDYSLHGTSPTTVLRPANIDQLSALVRQAHAEGAAVVPWGAGMRQHLGAAPTRYDIALVTTELERIIEHTPADLVVTVEAGMSLGVLQQTLAQHGQWLPWDPPAPPHATIGGLLATAASGPLRLGYGTPRDWTLGMRTVLGDGRIVKSGSKVVKNVAGYDAHKLHIGAFGTLGVIAEATFKLAPLPPTRRSLLLAAADLPSVVALMEELRAAPLAPVSLLALNEQMARLVARLTANSLGPGQWLVAARYAGSAAAVERQIAVAIDRSASVRTGAAPQAVDEEAETTFWRALAQVGAGGESLLLRGGARPSDLATLGDALAQPAARQGWNVALALYGGVGLAYALWSPTEQPADAATALGEVRASLPPHGYAVVENAPAALHPLLDLWGPPPATIELMRALKRQWNGSDTLNPGRYVV